MSYQKNVAGQKFNILAINVSTGRPITGDSVNITAKISIDSGPLASVVDTNPIELDATNAPGVYVFDLSQAETNGNVLTIVPSSTTANVEIDMINIYTTDTKNQLDDIEDQVGNILVDTNAIDSKTSQLTFTVSNQVDANSLTGGTSPSAVADAVWDESRSGHVSVGTFGEALDTVRTENNEIYNFLLDDTTNFKTVIAEGVWEELLTTHNTTDSFGWAVNKVPTVPADTYTYFTTGTNQDVFKADVTGIETTVNTINTNLSPSGYPFIYIEQIWENVYEEFPGNLLGAIADSVWDELSSGHITVGTFGKLASDILVDTDATIPAQISALNDFNPALDTVATVTLVGTCTTNSDMRGTDGANTIAPVDVSSDVSAIKSKSDQMSFTVTNQIDSNALSGGVSDLNLQLYDGVSFEDILISILSMTNGKIVETSSGAFDFYKQDNTTVLFTLTKSGNERNRS